MANIFGQPLITNVGRDMLLAVGAGNNTTIVYTNAAMFDQSINNFDAQQAAALTELSGQRMVAPIGLVSHKDTHVTVSTSFSNKGLKDSITFNTIGWFAKLHTSDGDGKEQLLAITPATSQGYLAAQSPDGESTQSIDMRLYMAIANDAKITIQANEDGVVYQAGLQQALEDQSNIFGAKLANAGKVKTISLNGGTPTQPDANGNINLSIQNEDVSGLASKTDLDKLRQDISSGNIGTYSKATLDGLLLAKADKSDTYTKEQTDTRITSVLSTNKYVNSLNGQQADTNGDLTLKGTKVSGWDFSAPETVKTTAGVDVTSLDAMTADDLRKIISKFIGVENEIQEIKGTALFGKTFRTEDEAMAYNATHSNTVCFVQN